MRAHRTRKVAIGILLALLLVAPGVVASDDPPQTSSNNSQGVGFGVLGGFTYNKLTGEDLFDTKGKTGWMGGIWFGGNRAGVVGFMGELSYVVKAAGDRNSESELKLHYLEIPAVLRINFGTPDKNGPCLYLLGGGVVDILLKGDLDGVDVKEQFNGYDAGVLAGVGFEVMRIGIEGRGNWGLVGLANDDGSFVSSDVKTFTFQIVGKIRFN